MNKIRFAFRETFFNQQFLKKKKRTTEKNRKIFRKIKIRISSFYMCNEYCGQNKSCRGDPTI